VQKVKERGKPNPKYEKNERYSSTSEGLQLQAEKETTTAAAQAVKVAERRMEWGTGRGLANAL
jgi:hypothetical protein